MSFDASTLHAELSSLVSSPAALGGIHAAGAVLLKSLARERTNIGQRVDSVPHVDTDTATITKAVLKRRRTVCGPRVTVRPNVRPVHTPCSIVDSYIRFPVTVADLARYESMLVDSEYAKSTRAVLCDMIERDRLSPFGIDMDDEHRRLRLAALEARSESSLQVQYIDYLIYLNHRLDSAPDSRSSNPNSDGRRHRSSRDSPLLSRVIWIREPEPMASDLGEFIVNELSPRQQRSRSAPLRRPRTAAERNEKRKFGDGRDDHNNIPPTSDVLDSFLNSQPSEPSPHLELNFSHPTDVHAATESSAPAGRDVATNDVAENKRDAINDRTDAYTAPVEMQSQCESLPASTDDARTSTIDGRPNGRDSSAGSESDIDSAESVNGARRYQRFDSDPGFRLPSPSVLSSNIDLSSWSSDHYPSVHFLSLYTSHHSSRQPAFNFASRRGVLFWLLLEHEIGLKLLSEIVGDQWDIHARAVPELAKIVAISGRTAMGGARLTTLDGGVGGGEVNMVLVHTRYPQLRIHLTAFDIHSMIANSFSSLVHDHICPRAAVRRNTGLPGYVDAFIEQARQQNIVSHDFDYEAMRDKPHPHSLEFSFARRKAIEPRGADEFDNEFALFDDGSAHLVDRNNNNNDGFSDPVTSSHGRQWYDIILEARRNEAANNVSNDDSRIPPPDATARSVPSEAIARPERPRSRLAPFPSARSRPSTARQTEVKYKLIYNPILTKPALPPVLTNSSMSSGSAADRRGRLFRGAMLKYRGTEPFVDGRDLSMSGSVEHVGVPRWTIPPRSDAAVDSRGAAKSSVLPIASRIGTVGPTPDSSIIDPRLSPTPVPRVDSPFVASRYRSAPLASSRPTTAVRRQLHGRSNATVSAFRYAIQNARKRVEMMNDEKEASPNSDNSHELSSLMREWKQSVACNPKPSAPTFPTAIQLQNRPRPRSPPRREPAMAPNLIMPDPYRYVPVKSPPGRLTSRSNNHPPDDTISTDSLDIRAAPSEPVVRSRLPIDLSPREPPPLTSKESTAENVRPTHHRSLSAAQRRELMKHELIASTADPTDDKRLRDEHKAEDDQIAVSADSRRQYFVLSSLRSPEAVVDADSSLRLGPWDIDDSTTDVVQQFRRSSLLFESIERRKSKLASDQSNPVTDGSEIIIRASNSSRRTVGARTKPPRTASRKRTQKRKKKRTTKAELKKNAAKEKSAQALLAATIAHEVEHAIVDPHEIITADSSVRAPPDVITSATISTKSSDPSARVCSPPLAPLVASNDGASPEFRGSTSPSDGENDAADDHDDDEGVEEDDDIGVYEPSVPVDDGTRSDDPSESEHEHDRPSPILPVRRGPDKIDSPTPGIYDVSRYRHHISGVQAENATVRPVLASTAAGVISSIRGIQSARSSFTAAKKVPPPKRSSDSAKLLAKSKVAIIDRKPIKLKKRPQKSLTDNNSTSTTAAYEQSNDTAEASPIEDNDGKLDASDTAVIAAPVEDDSQSFGDDRSSTSESTSSDSTPGRRSRRAAIPKQARRSIVILSSSVHAPTLQQLRIELRDYRKHRNTSKVGQRLTAEEKQTLDNKINDINQRIVKYEQLMNVEAELQNAITNKNNEINSLNERIQALRSNNNESLDQSDLTNIGNTVDHSLFQSLVESLERCRRELSQYETRLETVQSGSIAPNDDDDGSLIDIRDDDPAAVQLEQLQVLKLQLRRARKYSVMSPAIDSASHSPVNKMMMTAKEINAVEAHVRRLEDEIADVRNDAAEAKEKAGTNAQQREIRNLEPTATPELDVSQKMSDSGDRSVRTSPNIVVDLSSVADSAPDDIESLSPVSLERQLEAKHAALKAAKAAAAADQQRRDAESARITRQRKRATLRASIRMDDPDIWQQSFIARTNEPQSGNVPESHASYWEV